jgi:hypothetical protein
MTPVKRLRTVILFVVTLFSSTLLAAPALVSQDTSATGDGDLQRGFSALELGMTFESAKDALATDPSFLYRGEPDVQFLPLTERPIIEVEGRAFIDTAILQFRDDALFVLSLVLDRTRLDYFSVYESLVARYGQPTALDPGQAVWDDGRTRVSLERPLTVKYLDVALFTELVESGEMEEALDAVTRDRFLDQL